MARHRDNLSFYYTKGKRIFWTIELMFWNDYPNFEKINKASQGPTNKYLRLILDPQDENQTLIEIVENMTLDDQSILLLLNTMLGHTNLTKGFKDGDLLCYICDEDVPRDQKIWLANTEEPLK